MLKGTDKDTAKLLRAAERQGWRVSLTKGNHIKCIPPNRDGQILIGALTGSRSSGIKFRAAMLKAGVHP